MGLQVFRVGMSLLLFRAGMGLLPFIVRIGLLLTCTVQLTYKVYQITC